MTARSRVVAPVAMLCADSFSRKRSLEIAFPLFEFHGALFVVVDGAIFAFGAAERNHFLDDLRHGVSIGTDRARAGNATERPHATLQLLCFLPRQELPRVIDHDNETAA